ncbi:MAG: DUF1957 domain-containing protein [Chloroflexi bacterium]|nr:DUF1957 domain-containing protein [Chloroflexota bacterium]
MTGVGSFQFVLHSHIPYARKAGKWPHGEEWLHEAASETYIPLLKKLYKLRAEGVPFRIAIGITPILAEQLADTDVQEHFVTFLDQRIAASEYDIQLHHEGDGADPHLHYLASWYRDWYTGIREAFLGQFERNLLAAFRQLEDEGYVELLTSAATHAYLPLLAQDASIRLQLQTALNGHQRHFGKKPRGIWLPECAYRPAYYEGDRLRPGMEHFISEASFDFTFSETHAITGGRPVGIAAGDVLGPYGEVVRRYAVPIEEYRPVRPVTTFEPYRIINSESSDQSHENALTEICVFGRNDRTGIQVWGADWGYPGDFDYREFHKRAGSSGLQYWRVTNSDADLSHKEHYQPEWAAMKCQLHADHFIDLVVATLQEYHATHDSAHGIISSNYDTELFGHWWFEGVDWLGKVLRGLAEHDEVDLTTPSQYLCQHPVSQGIRLPESSWGAGGRDFTWNNGDNRWMWRPIHELEERLIGAAAKIDPEQPDEDFVMKQAARELLLTQSSDWPFLVSTGQARSYAIQRFSQHAERCNRLLNGLEKGKPDRALAEEYWELDKVFPDIDYRLFRDG